MLRKRLLLTGIPLLFIATANAQIRPATQPVPAPPPTKANPSKVGPQPNTPGKTPMPVSPSPAPQPANPTSPVPPSGTPAPTGVSPLPTVGNPTPTRTGAFGQPPPLRPSPSGPLRTTPAPTRFGSPATQQTLTSPQRSSANSFPFQQYSLSSSNSLQPRRLQIGQDNPLNSANIQPQGVLPSNSQILQNGLFNQGSLGFSNGPMFDTGAMTGSSLSAQPFMTDWARSVGFGRFENMATRFPSQQTAFPSFQPGEFTSPMTPSNTVPNSNVGQPAANATPAPQQPAMPAAPTQFPPQSAGGVGPIPRQ